MELNLRIPTTPPPRQQRIAFPRPREARSRPPFKRVIDRYQQGNLTAARVVLEDVAKYGGETAGLVIWARLTLAHASGGQR